MNQCAACERPLDPTLPDMRDEPGGDPLCYECWVTAEAMAVRPDALDDEAYAEFWRYVEAAPEEAA